MEKLDIVTNISRAQFERVFLFSKSFFSDDLIEKIEQKLSLTNSLLVPLSAAIIMIAGIIFAIKLEMFTCVLGALVLVLFIFFGDYISVKFHRSCRAALEANPTSISSNAYLELIVFLNIFLVVGLVIGGTYFAIQQSSMTILVWCLAGATLSLLVIVPVLNPHLINMNVSNKSGAASDLIGLWSIGIKSLLFYSKLFSQLSIILGAILLFIATIHAMGNNIMNAMSEAPIGLGILFAGFFFPVIVNLVFMILYFIFDIFLAVLSIKGTKASADTAKE